MNYLEDTTEEKLFCGVLNSIELHLGALGADSVMSQTRKKGVNSESLHPGQKRGRKLDREEESKTALEKTYSVFQRRA